MLRISRRVYRSVSLFLQNNFSCNLLPKSILLKSISNYAFIEPILPQTRRPRTSWPSTAVRRIWPGRYMSSSMSSVTATLTHATTSPEKIFKLNLLHLQRLVSVMGTGEAIVATGHTSEHGLQVQRRHPQLAGQPSDRQPCDRRLN